MPPHDAGRAPIEWAERVFGGLARVAIVIAAASLVLMALVEAWQVFARYVLNDSPSWTEPVALLLMSAAMMLGAAVGVRNNAHFGFFIGVEMAPPKLRSALLIVARAIGALIGLLLAGWGGELLLDNWTIHMAGAPLPQGIVYLPICVGGALIAVFSLERIFVPARAVTPVTAAMEQT